MTQTLLAAAANGLPALYWDPSPNFTPGRRLGAKPTVLIIHDCEGSAKGSEAWFDMQKSSVSAHFVLSEDGTQLVQQVRLADTAWACCWFNRLTVNFELGGFEAKGFSEAEWDAAARCAACLCHLLNIPVRATKPTLACAIAPGIARHYDLGKLGGSHTDPTEDDLKWTWFLGLVAKQAAAGGFPLRWSMP